MVMFGFDLAEELAGTGITVNSLHPASLMNTKMVTDTDYFGGALTTVQQGADAAEYLATSSELANVTGEYFDGKLRARADGQAYDREARARLRLLSEQWTGVVEPAGAARR
jgi:NAD(P)-dependent dehydrogenase (short-subunit alcohol dehydrogenase family)